MFTDLVSNWRFPVVLWVIAGFGIMRWFAKKHVVTSDSATRSVRLLMQFGMSLLGATILLLLQQNKNAFEAFKTPSVIPLCGFGSAIACYFHWKAMGISLSKVSIFAIWDDIIAMTLSYIVLKEGRFLNSGIIGGVLLAIISVTLLGKYSQQKTAEARATDNALYRYILTYSVLWGVARFSIRYFSAHDLPVSVFLVNWYFGATVAALCIVLQTYWSTTETRHMSVPTIMKRDVGIMCLYGLGIVTCMYIEFWAYKAPHVVVQPIFLVSEALLSTAIGLWIFREKERLDRHETAYMGIGLLSTVLIALSF